MEEVTSDDESLDRRPGPAPDDDGDDDDPLFDHQQNVARAAFDDMVNDHERNMLFYRAIQKSIRELESQGRPTWTLDIGSGTGLLSMMAVKSGAERVTACECFEPMAQCSRRIIAQNGMADSITVLSGRSTELSLVGKPQLLVAELLDTELIGEGCLFTYRDAIKRLLEPDAQMVPTRGRLWVQLVQSAHLFQYHQFVPPEGLRIRVPSSALNCFGSHLLHDLQMNRLEPGRDFDIIAEPQLAFEFEFNLLDSLKLKDHRRLCFSLQREFREPLALLAWWDIDLDHEAEFRLSCAPDWARPDRQSWREHWLQTIYFLPAFAFDRDRQVDGFLHDQINERGCLWVDAFHDSFSFWFDLPEQSADPDEHHLSDSEPWSCTCGLHSQLSRNRLCQMNDGQRYEKYWRALCAQLDGARPQTQQLLYLGDESLLPLLCASHPSVQQVIVLVMDRAALRFFRQFRNENHLQNRMKLCSVQGLRLLLRVDGIISELYFRYQTVQLPCLQYFGLLEKHCQHLLSSKPFTMPYRIAFRCLLVQFEHLGKCYSPVGSKVCDGHFDLREYDRLVQTARRAVDWSLEPKFLWEYGCTALQDEPIELFSLGLSNVVDADRLHRSITINTDSMEAEADTVAIVCWYDQHLSSSAEEESSLLVGGGPVTGFQAGQPISWVRHQPQYVGFLGSDRWHRPSLRLEFELCVGKQCSLSLKW